LKIYGKKINDFQGSPEVSLTLCTFKGHQSVLTLPNGQYTTIKELMGTGGELCPEIIHERNLDKSETRLDNSRSFSRSVDLAKRTINASHLDHIAHFITLTFRDETAIHLGQEKELQEASWKFYKRLTYYYPKIYGAFVAFEIHPKRKGNIWHIHLLTYSEEWFRIDLNLFNRKIWNLGRSNIQDARKIEDKANYLTTYLTKEGGKKSNKVFLYPKSFRPWRWYGKAKGEVLEERFEVRSPALPHGAEHPKPLDELNKQIEIAKAELEAKGYELKHSFSVSMGSSMLERERVRIASKYPLGLFDEGFKREWESFKAENEERLLTMAYSECRFRKKSVRQQFNASKDGTE